MSSSVGTATKLSNMPNFKNLNMHTIAYLVGVLSPLIFLRPNISAALEMDPDPETRCTNCWRFMVLLAIVTVALHYCFMVLKKQDQYYQGGAALLVWWVSYYNWERIMMMLVEWGFFEIGRQPVIVVDEDAVDYE